jgi:hypothetical protein
MGNTKMLHFETTRLQLTVNVVLLRNSMYNCKYLKIIHLVHACLQLIILLGKIIVWPRLSHSTATCGPRIQPKCYIAGKANQRSLSLPMATIEARKLTAPD